VTPRSRLSPRSKRHSASRDQVISGTARHAAKHADQPAWLNSVRRGFGRRSSMMFRHLGGSRASDPTSHRYAAWLAFQSVSMLPTRCLICPGAALTHSTYVGHPGAKSLQLRRVTYPASRWLRKVEPPVTEHNLIEFGLADHAVRCPGWVEVSTLASMRPSSIERGSEFWYN
jgi:hypothetical protein